MKAKIFEVMSDVIGWNLEDFDAVAQADLDTLTKYWNKIDDCFNNNKPIVLSDNEFEDLKDAMGFCIDFMRAVAIIENTLKMEVRNNEDKFI